MSPRYMRIIYRGDSPDYPHTVISEIDAAGNETRKVQIYDHGCDFASEAIEVGRAGLSETTMGSPEEAAQDPALEVRELTKREFEDEWDRALRWYGMSP